MSATAKIHVLKAKAGLDDNAYRDLLESVTGQRSAKGLEPGQELSVISTLERLVKGAPAQPGNAQRASGPYARKLQALWMALHDLGAINDRSDKSMMAFVERQTGLSHTRFLSDPVDARKAIEALKSMARRRGVEWLTPKSVERQGLSQIQADRWAVIIAQARILREANAHMDVLTIAFSDINKPLPVEQLLERQTLLGRHVRKLVGGEA